MSEIALQTPPGLSLRGRAMTPDDLPAILALERRVQAFPWRQSSFEDYLDHPRAGSMLAFDASTLAGFVVLSHGGGDAELLNIAVAPDYQRWGVGHCLLQWAFDCARPHADLLFLEVRVSNRRAIAFYYSAGFFETGRRPNYYPTANGREDALLLAYHLI